MKNINFKKLKTLAENQECKNDIAQNSEDIMNAYFSLEENLKNLFQNLKQDEAINYIISTQNWINKKEHTKWKGEINGTKISIGDIFIANLGSKYKPEIAYTHPVSILEIIKNYVLVIPTTTNTETYASAYHPIANPNGKKQYRRVESKDGFDKDCSLILSNILTISKGRLLDKKGCILDQKLYDEIKMQTFYLSFPIQFRQYNNTIQELYFLKNNVKEFIKHFKSHLKNTQELNDMIQAMENKLK